MKKGIVTRWKRPLAAALGTLFVLGAVCGMGGGVLPDGVRDALPEEVRETVMPLAAQASGNDLAMSQGAGVLQSTANTANAQIVHFGGNEWYVIGYGGSGVASASGNMTLIAKDNLETRVQFNTISNENNQYSGSNLQTKVNVIADALPEKDYIAPRNLTVGDYNSSAPYETDGVAVTAVDGAILWPLSTKEAAGMNPELRNVGDYWWLRSPGDRVTDAAVVERNGNIYAYGGHVLSLGQGGVRPAFNINLSSVIFTSAAVGGKSSVTVGADALTAVSAMSSASPSNVNEWKLTLKDSNRTFSVKNPTYDSNAKVLKFTYENAKTTSVTPSNEFVSVIVTDSTEKIIKYYGRIVENRASGDATVNLAGKIDVTAGDKVFAFSEQCNWDKKTDYASALQAVSLSTPPATALSITTTTLASGRAGESYTATLSASGTAPITWNATGLPAGLSIEPSTGTISGTPTESGTFTVNVTATNSEGSNTKTLSLKIDPASAPAPTPVPAHNHQYEWVTLLEADEHNDGEMVYRCRDCGDVLYRVPISAYFIFNKNTMQKILDAPQGASLSVQTRRFISFHKMVMQALSERPDVTLQVSFLDEEYRGNRMTFTIPAGTDTLSLPNEEGYCGFLYLGGVFGLHPAEGS